MKITDDTIGGAGTFILSKNKYAFDYSERTEAAPHLTIRGFHIYLCNGDNRWKRSALWAAACFIFGWDEKLPNKVLAATMLALLYAIFGMQIYLFSEGLARGSWVAALAFVGVVMDAFAVAIVSKKESWSHVT